MHDWGTVRRSKIFAFVGALLVHVLILVIIERTSDSWASVVDREVEDKGVSKDPKVPLEMVFVEIPEASAEKPPEETPFYSTEDSVAHTENPDQPDESISPQEGEQEDTLRLEESDIVDSMISQLTEQESTEDQNPEMVDSEAPSEMIPESPELAGHSEIAPPDLPESVAALPDFPEEPESAESEFVASESPSEVPGIADIEESLSDEVKLPAPRESQPEILPTPVPAPPATRAKPNARPSSLVEARKRLKLVGQKTTIHKQSKSRIGQTGMVDALNRSFGDYDLRMQVAIQNLWYSYVDNLIAGTIERGAVIIKFRLHESGSIETTQVMESAVGRLLTAPCQDAIENAAPYGVWSKKMREEIGKSFRDITFTFNYR